MKKNEGMTLISIVTGIAILLLICTIPLTMGMDSYNEIKVQNFISKMKVIQAKVDIIAQETDDVSDYGFRKLSELSATDEIKFKRFSGLIENAEENNIDTSKSWKNGVDDVIDNYYYFSKQDLESKLGLKNQDLDVVINFKTRNVISQKGVITKDKKTYYRQYDLSGGDQLMN